MWGKLFKTSERKEFFSFNDLSGQSEAGREGRGGGGVQMCVQKKIDPVEDKTLVTLPTLVTLIFLQDQTRQQAELNGEECECEELCLRRGSPLAHWVMCFVISSLFKFTYLFKSRPTYQVQKI